MSMLAEKKRKQRWSLNPRGNAWTEDTNKFGQKMLEKMGWKHGKGLGANEDGIKEQVKVSYKNDSKGMGFKEIEGWTEHESNFSALLKNLSNTPDAEQIDVQIKSTSLEEMSQKSRVRVHYHKFTKGKDLSRYSEKDLASIFGKKSLKPQGDAANPEKNEKFIKKGCMVDYFKKKLPNFSLNTNGFTVGSNGVLQIESEALEGGQRGGLGYKETARSLTVDCSQEIKEGEAHSKKQRKRKLEETKNNEEIDVKLKSEKKKRRKSNNEDLLNETNQEEKTSVGEENGNETIKEKKKNRKVKTEETEDLKSTFVSYLKKDDSADNNEKESKEEGKINKLEKKKGRKSNNADFQEEVSQEERAEEIKSKDENIKEDKRNWKAKLKDTNVSKNLNESDKLEGSEENLKEDCKIIKKLQKKKQHRNNNDEYNDVQSSPNENLQNNEVKNETEVIKPEKKKQRKSNNADLQNQINKGDQTLMVEDIKVNEGEYNENIKESKKNRKMKLKETEAVKTTFISYLNREDNLENDEHLKKEPEKIKSEKRKQHINEETNQIKTSSEENTPKTKFHKKKKNLEANDKHVVEETEKLNMKQNPELDTKELKLRKKEKASKKRTNEAEAENHQIKLTPQSAEKRSNKQKKNVDDNDQGISNPAFDPRFNNIVVKKHALNTIVESEETFNDAESETPTNQKPKKKKDHRATGDESLDKIEGVEPENAGFDNPSFKNCSEENSAADIQDNPYEVKFKEKKKKKRKIERNDNDRIDNPVFCEGTSHEIKIKSKKRKLNDELLNGETNEEKYEVKRKEKKLKKIKREDDALALDNHGFQEGVEYENQYGKTVKETSVNVDEELLLNVASFPVPEAVQKREVRRSSNYRKSVTFNEVIDRRMFHNNYQKPNHYDNNWRSTQNGDNYYKQNRYDNSWRVTQNDDNYYEENCFDNNESFTQNGDNYYQPNCYDNNGSFTQNGDNYYKQNRFDNNEGFAQNGDNYYQPNCYDNNGSFTQNGDNYYQPNCYDNNGSFTQNGGDNYYKQNHFDNNEGFAQNGDNYYKPNRYDNNERFQQNGDNYYRQNRYDNNERFQQNGNNYYRQNRNEHFNTNPRVMQNGIDNAGYDRRANNMQENIAHMSRTIDRYHAEIENDINETKAGRSYYLQQCFVGEPGEPSEKHTKHEEGTRLSFQNVSFGKLPVWMRNQKGTPGPKKSYRHLIRGDIVIKFNDTNLHEITGYATSPCRT